ncbi:exocyst complex protein exo70, putative [Anopheles sinensis]|uniref:Exocyst complex protein exo70, putative n=1 Tax=Anopheles sinensis TaxID=74873 RepID=A0A084WUH4_ANOSI|nr:exocyst complex protein exo70, putative [Anopheles sinensis]
MIDCQVTSADAVGQVSLPTVSSQRSFLPGCNPSKHPSIVKSAKSSRSSSATHIFPGLFPPNVAGKLAKTKHSPGLCFPAPDIDRLRCTGKTTEKKKEEEEEEECLVRRNPRTHPSRTTSVDVNLDPCGFASVPVCRLHG